MSKTRDLFDWKMEWMYILSLEGTDWMIPYCKRIERAGQFGLWKIGRSWPC